MLNAYDLHNDLGTIMEPRTPLGRVQPKRMAKTTTNYFQSKRDPDKAYDNWGGHRDRTRRKSEPLIKFRPMARSYKRKNSLLRKTQMKEKYYENKCVTSSNTIQQLQSVIKDQKEQIYQYQIQHTDLRIRNRQMYELLGSYAEPAEINEQLSYEEAEVDPDIGNIMLIQRAAEFEEYVAKYSQDDKTKEIFDAMRMPALKQASKERGLSTHGLKQEVIKRYIFVNVEKL